MIVISTNFVKMKLTLIKKMPIKMANITKIIHEKRPAPYGYILLRLQSMAKTGDSVIIASSKIEMSLMNHKK